VDLIELEQPLHRLPQPHHRQPVQLPASAAPTRGLVVRGLVVWGPSVRGLLVPVLVLRVLVVEGHLLQRSPTGLRLPQLRMAVLGR
jgi:hypothetical protein